MTSPLSRLFKDAKPQEAAMLPGNRFFVRRLTVEGEDVPGQVNLALEAISPFPLEQMLVGFVTSADGKQVLAYAAHRRRFTAEESFAWPEDCQVVPEFLALCGHRPTADAIIVHRGDERLTALAWKAGDELPLAIVVAELADADEAGIAREAAVRADLPADVAVENVTGALSGSIVEGDLVLKREGNGTFTIPKKGLDDSDIRDSDFLAERRKKERLNLILWNAARLGAAVIVVSLILDLAGMVVGMRSSSLEAANEARRPVVEDIEASQAITSRILELGVKRLLPIEMLALVNEKRPATVEFTNIQCELKKAKDSTIAKPMMTVDAKTPNAGDISDFLKAVQAMPEVEAATNSEPRVRETSTTFRIEITFKQAVLLKAAETPKQ
jgi:Fe2+ transport system protein FeoA